MRTLQITPTAKAMTGRKTRSENSKREVEPQSIVRRNVHRPSDGFAVVFWPPTHPQISRTRRSFHGRQFLYVPRYPQLGEGRPSAEVRHLHHPQPAEQGS